MEWMESSTAKQNEQLPDSGGFGGVGATSCSAEQEGPVGGSQQLLLL